VAHEGLLGIPEWLFVGLGTGVGVSVLATGLFALVDRRYPNRTETETDRGRNGDSRRRSELREYLDAIGESYAEDHSVEGQSVAFYLPSRDVAITFDPRAYYRIERAGTYAVLVEHEMPGVQLGYRLPFDVPDVWFGAPDEEAKAEATGYRASGDDPAAAAFAELGVSAGASREEVRSAYRRRVKEAHPDQGGDEDEFKRVRQAYTTARKHAG